MLFWSWRTSPFMHNSATVLIPLRAAADPPEPTRSDCAGNQPFGTIRRRSEPARSGKRWSRTKSWSSGGKVFFRDVGERRVLPVAIRHDPISAGPGDIQRRVVETDAELVRAVELLVAEAGHDDG